MDFYRVLQSILEEKGISIPEAARLCGLSDSTVRTILTRKSKSVSLEVAFKLSSGLGVSLDYLNNGIADRKTEPLPIKKLNDFTADEKTLIYAYRQASSDDRTVVDAALRKYTSLGDAGRMA